MNTNECMRSYNGNIGNESWIMSMYHVDLFIASLPPTSASYTVDWWAVFNGMAV